jgi:hypothetical protein
MTDTMQAQIGIWHDSVALFLAEPLGTPAVLSLDENSVTGEVTFDVFTKIPAGSGFNMVIHTQDRAEQDFLPWILRDVECVREGFARCEVMDIILVKTRWGWRSKLPMKHDMPWPRARDCQSYYRAEELYREVKIRRLSATKAGVVPPSIPPHIQKDLTPRMRVEYFGGLNNTEAYA